jgi:hypothetical protein
MISVLVGFFTIFIGVFMVNDSKSSPNFSSRKNSADNSAYNVELGFRDSKAEFVPLKDMESIAIDGNIEEI